MLARASFMLAWGGRFLPLDSSFSPSFDFGLCRFMMNRCGFIGLSHNSHCERRNLEPIWLSHCVGIDQPPPIRNMRSLLGVTLDEVCCGASRPLLRSVNHASVARHQSVMVCVIFSTLVLARFVFRSMFDFSYEMRTNLTASSGLHFICRWAKINCSHASNINAHQTRASSYAAHG